MAAHDLVDLCLGGLLLAVIYFDLRFMLLPNMLAALFVVVFALGVSWTLPWDILTWRVAIAVGFLVLGIAVYAAGVVGGGDVKVLSALMLFIPQSDLLGFFMALCLCTVAGILGLLGLRRALRGRGVTWRGLQDNGRYPFGISIGLAGLLMRFSDYV